MLSGTYNLLQGPDLRLKCGYTAHGYAGFEVALGELEAEVAFY